jgi:hypothetical protein
MVKHADADHRPQSRQPPRSQLALKLQALTLQETLRLQALPLLPA